MGAEPEVIIVVAARTIVDPRRTPTMNDGRTYVANFTNQNIAQSNFGLRKSTSDNVSRNSMMDKNARNGDSWATSGA